MMHLLDVLINWCSNNPKAVAGLVAGAAALSVILESVLTKLQRKFVDFAHKPAFKKLAFTLLHVFTILTTLATYWLSAMPKQDLLPVYATLTILAEGWHRFVISGAFSKVIVPFLEWQAGQKASAPVGVPDAAVNELV